MVVENYRPRGLGWLMRLASNFIQVTGGSVVWEKRISWLTGDGRGNLRLKAMAREFDLQNENDTKIAKIIWDGGDKPENKTLKCVVFGTTETKVQTDVVLKQHYVLVDRSEGLWRYRRLIQESWRWIFARKSY
jgi:hypothetical protein